MPLHHVVNRRALPKPAVAVAEAPQHVAHMAPICALFDLPLIVTSRRAAQAAEWYPEVQRRLCPGYAEELPIAQLASTLEAALRPYEIVFSARFFRRADVEARFARLGWHPRLVFCPHGFSEKNGRSDLEAEQDIRLVYRLTPSDGAPHRIVIGDLQHWYYDTHRAEVDARIARVLTAPMAETATILYTPTWVDWGKRTSIFELLERLVAGAAAGYTLIVKPHPNLWERPDEIAFIRRVTSSSPRTILLEECPYTHPLLSRVDVLITDMSAMAYLFLRYRRPVILLNQSAGTIADCASSRLSRCAVVVGKDEYDQIWNIVMRQLDRFRADPRLADAGAALYGAAYGWRVGVEQLAAEIGAACEAPPNSQM